MTTFLLSVLFVLSPFYSFGAFKGRNSRRLCFERLEKCNRSREGRALRHGTDPTEALGAQNAAGEAGDWDADVGRVPTAPGPHGDRGPVGSVPGSPQAGSLLRSRVPLERGSPVVPHEVPNCLRLAANHQPCHQSLHQPPTVSPTTNHQPKPSNGRPPTARVSLGTVWVHPGDGL